ncbi:hypothetical protein LTR10_007778 [Elasticomyces elasticus]|nr:hypothetical protein LTR10_007778 [Elasticomyces elasticus]KAK4970778.1 hypothetical protein LTR42_007755 [Elasticomyces elasticus]
MAAADYYNPGGGGMPHATAQQAPRPQQPLRPLPQNMSPLPYPISDAPPPYSAFSEQRPQSQPPPHSRPQSHVDFAPTNNYPPAQHGYPPDKQGYRPSAMQSVYPPQQPQYPPQQSQYPPQQPQYQPVQPPAPQQGYPYPNGKPIPGLSTVGRRPSAVPYTDRDRDRDSSRSRSRSRSRRRHHHHHREQPQPKKKSGVSTFLGAGGGAIIGDVIFPGLGTLGGALLGGVGGHEYAKKRSYSNPSRSRSYNDDYYDGRGRRK